MIEEIYVEGDAYARGTAHGFACKSEIRRHIADLLKTIERAGVSNAPTYIAEMLQSTDFVTATMKYAPELLEEVRGIATGAGESHELIFALQVMDEEWAHRRRYLASAVPIEKCSSLAFVSPSGATWVGQNMDLGDYTDGHQILLRIAAHDVQPAALVFSTAGMIGLMGVNAHGVAVCVNALSQLPSATKGVPVAFVIRKLLQARNVAEAVETINAIPHATGQHYLIAEAGVVRSFEASPEGVFEYHSPDPGKVAHTNHTLTGPRATVQPTADQSNTVARLRSLTERMVTRAFNVDGMQAALASFDDPDHPVCMVRSEHVRHFTTGSMISELRKDAPEVDSWVSAGPPNGGYTAFHLSRDLRKT